MEIKKLIKVYEELLPIYKKAFERDVCFPILYDLHLHYGICKASKKILNINIYKIINKYYTHYMEPLTGYLFPIPNSGKDLKTRIDFMKTEIKDLNKLLKKGYTHV